MGVWYLCGSHKCVTKRYRQTQFTNGQNTQFANLLKLFSAQPPFFTLERKGALMFLCLASRDGNGHRHSKSMQTFTAGFLSQYSPLYEDTGNWCNSCAYCNIQQLETLYSRDETQTLNQNLASGQHLLWQSSWLDVRRPSWWIQKSIGKDLLV